MSEFNWDVKVASYLRAGGFSEHDLMAYTAEDLYQAIKERLLRELYIKVDLNDFPEYQLKGTS